MHDFKKFGIFLSSLREEAAVKIPVVADRLRVKEADILLWESGKDLIPQQYLEPLSSLYNIPYQELLDVWNSERKARRH